jgi:WD40 repeat protein
MKKTKVYRPQYWVIDALDECIKYPEFFTLLSKLEVAFPLRILVTSRIIPEIQTHFARFGTNVISTEIHLEDSMQDIEAYIQTRIKAIPLDGSQERQDLAGKILAKSGGSFLWVHLVLHELSSVYTDKSIWTVLDEIPEGMVPFYQRTVDIMSRNSREKDVAKAILLWTVYSVRPLQTSELQQALKLDIGANVLSIKKTIEGLCGQLVYVDKNDTVQIVHATAREFLIGDATSEFAIPKQKGHERIALSCLRYLCSDEMKPPRNRRFLYAPRGAPSVFRDYACTAFSEHVFSAFSEADSLLTALDSFLKTNVLSWIEHVAQKDSLYYLSRTAKNLKGYLERRAKYLSPLGSQVERVDSWVTDLTRLVAKFGVSLTTLPSSIYFLIPPLCPISSAIFKQFGKSPDGLVLSGVKNVAWEDCISWIDFNNSATSLASGDKAFAVGMETGDIEIYNRGSCQWERTIQHQEPLDALQFDTSGDFLASCGSRSIKLWNINGNELWTHKLTSRIIEIAFGTNSVVGVSINGLMTTWNLRSGDVMGDPQRYHYKSPAEESGKIRARAPHTASLSPDFDAVAFGYRSRDVGLWDLQNHEFIGWCLCPESDTVSLVLFNPNPNIGIIAVGYKDSSLAIFDPWSQELIHSVKIGAGTQEVSSLASSPDGRTLVTVDSCGTMQVWDFETLTLLYHVKSSDLGFRLVAFSSNGLRIVDLMDSRLRVWEPAVLIRKTIEEDVSVSDAAIMPAIQGQDESKGSLGITVIVCHPTLSIVFVGKYNGSVAAYTSKTGKEDAILYSHSKSAFVTAIAASSLDILASGDVNGNVQVWQLGKTPTRTLKTSSLMLNTSTGKAIKQLLINPTGDFILISTAVSDSVFSTRDGTCIGKLTFSSIDRTRWKWISRVSARPELLLIVDDKLQRYSWDRFPSLSSPQILTLPLDSWHQMKDTSIRTAVLDADGQNLIVDFHKEYDTVAANALLILSIGTILSSAPSTTPIILAPNPAHIGLGEHVKYFLELSGSRLLFIDSVSWLSSVDLNTGVTTGDAGEYTRHFFVPNEFVARETGILPVLSPDKDVVFVTEGELAVVRNGLKFQTVARMSDGGRKWSYASGMSDESLNRRKESDASVSGMSDDGRKPSYVSGMSGDTRRPSYLSGMSDDMRKLSDASGMSDDG